MCHPATASLRAWQPTRAKRFRGSDFGVPSGLGFRASDLPRFGAPRRHRSSPYHLATIPIQSLPTIFLLPCADKDLLAGLGFAVLLHVEIGNVALPVLRCREQAQVGAVPPLLTTRAAWCLGKDHDVLCHRPGNPQTEPQAAIDAMEKEGFNRVGAEHHGLWRPREHFCANPGPGVVDTLKVHLPGERPRLPEPGVAFHLRPGSHPGPPLLLSQLPSPRSGDGPKIPPRPPPCRRAHVPGDDIPAPEQPPASHIEDVVAAPATFGYIENLHAQTGPL
jgi:hypothetical protein